MDAPILPTTGNADWAEHVTVAISRQRERLREFLAAQQERLQGAEGELAAHLQELAGELAQERNDVRQARDDITRRSEELDARHADLRQRQEQVAAVEKQVAEEQRTLESARGRSAAELEQLAALHTRLDAQQAELAARAEQLAAREAETAAQRRRIAREVKTQRAAQLAELERLFAERPPVEAVEHGALQRELDAARQREQQLTAEVESLHAECEQLSRTMVQAAAAATTAGDDSAEQEDFRRRYEMSLEDLRDLKARNAELQQQLAAAKAAGPAAAPQKGGVLNWEAEKQRILAALESDSGGADKPTKEERLKLEEVVHRTDQLLADKEREINELKLAREHQSGNLGAVAVGAAALGDMLDKDTIVCEERQNLKRLQEEWRDKLRQAEIDISMERAKIARERAQIEERLRTLESQTATAAEKPDDSDKEGKPIRGRWLARLGLKEINEGGGKK